MKTPEEQELERLEKEAEELEEEAPAPEAPAAEEEPTGDADVTDTPDDDELPTDVKTLQDRLRAAERERQGLRRDLFRTRERARQARLEQTFRRPAERQIAQPEEEREEEPAAPEAGVEIEWGEDGKARIPADALRRQISRPERGAASPQQREVAAAQIERVRRYNEWRAQIIEDDEAPEEAAEVLDRLEVAYSWLDRKVMEAMMASQVRPQGFDQLKEFVEAEGIDRRFSRLYPGVDWKTLVRAPQEREALRSVVKQYRSKGAARREERSERDETERRGALRRVAAAPRTLRHGQRGNGRGLTLKTLDDLTPDEVLSLSAEEIRELERQLGQ